MNDFDQNFQEIFLILFNKIIKLIKISFILNIMKLNYYINLQPKYDLFQIIKFK